MIVVQLSPNPASYEPWDVVADANGNFETSWYIFSEELIGATMQVTGTGQTSGFTASATFTDAVPPKGVAPVSPPTGGFAIEGDLLSNTPTSCVLRRRRRLYLVRLHQIRAIGTLAPVALAATF